MCGIAGIVAFDGADGWEDRVVTAARKLAHRGPDDEGVLALPGAIIAHRRLSILDLSAAGRQPMRSSHLDVVFNGEIYNYRELREELRRHGVSFSTDTDTEVLLKAWLHWGEDAMKRFVGMWAFALIDRSKNAAYLARDPFGIKPLYVARIDGALAFASEIPALLAMGMPARANLDRIVDYVLTGITDHTQETFFDGVNALTPGHLTEINLATGCAVSRQYYAIPSGVPEAAGPDMWAALIDSVRLHMRSDVPVGTCLSGGLDSSVVAALAANEMRRGTADGKFVAVTARADQLDIDESEFARRVVESSGLDWVVVTPSYDTFACQIEACLLAQAEPVVSPSVYMQYAVMQRARQAGLKVMLDGQGGDETLLGYERYYVAYFLELIRSGKWSTAHREFRLAARHSKLSMTQLVAYSAYFGIPTLRRARLRRRAWFVSRDLVRRANATIDSLTAGFFSIEAMQRAELTRVSLPHLLRYEDRNSMSWGVEARVPFVTPRFVETALGLPASQKIRDGYTKYALRAAADHVIPHEIAWRRNKFGFEAPTTKWMASHASVVERELEHSRILRGLAPAGVDLRTVDSGLAWRLYNLAVWERGFGATA